MNNQQINYIDALNSVKSLIHPRIDYRTIFNNAPVAIVIALITGEILDANPAMIMLMGYSLNELKQSNITLFYENIKNRYDFLSILSNRGEVRDFETIFKKKDQTTFNALLNTDLIQFCDYFYLITSIRDITIKKQYEETIKQSQKELTLRVQERTYELNQKNTLLEKEIQTRLSFEKILKEKEEQYRAIVEAFDGLIYICNQDYLIEFMNDRFIQRSGKDGKGEICYQILHNLDSICPWCVNDRVFKGETVRWEIKSPKDNHWYYVVNTPIYHNDGSISKQAMILDITEKKEVEEKLKKTYEELRQTYAQLVQSEKLSAIGQLASGVAHEINNPLSPILSFINVIEQQFINAPKLIHSHFPNFLDILNKMKQGVMRCKKITNSLLDFATQNDEKKIHSDISLALEKSLDIIGFQIDKKRIHLKIQIEQNLPKIKANLNQFQHVFTNLFLNAIYFTKPEGQIHISIYKKKSHIHIDFEDTGEGIAKDHIKKVFNPFFTTKPIGQGTGLGLSKTYGIIQDHNGSIIVNSEPGRGTKFMISLPIK